MATMYVYNIPTNETVNLRATPNGTILVRVPYGARLLRRAAGTTLLTTIIPAISCPNT